MTSKEDAIIRNYIKEKNSKYPIGVYEFLLWVLKILHNSSEEQVFTENVVVYTFRDLILENFGLMSLCVLDFWNIKNTEDIGSIINHFIEMDLILDHRKIHNLKLFKDKYDMETTFNSIESVHQMDLKIGNKLNSGPITKRKK